MSHPESLSQWIETVSTMFPKLSRPQAKVLAYWRFGMVLEKRVWRHAGVLRWPCNWAAKKPVCCNACGNGATVPKAKKGTSAGNWT